MSNFFTVNNRKYEAKPVSFYMICEFGKLGLSLEDIGRKTIPFINAYFSFCSGLSEEQAAGEIERHIISNGMDGLNEISTAMMKAFEESDFFRNLQKNSEKKNRKINKAEEE